MEMVEVAVGSRTWSCERSNNEQQMVKSDKMETSTMGLYCHKPDLLKTHPTNDPERWG